MFRKEKFLVNEFGKFKNLLLEMMKNDDTKKYLLDHHYETQKMLIFFNEDEFYFGYFEIIDADPQFRICEGTYHNREPLFLFACEKSSWAIADHAMSKEKDLKRKGLSGKNLLHCAVINESVEILKKLIEKNVIDINEPDFDGYPPIFYSLYSTTSEKLEMFLNHENLEINIQPLGIFIRSVFEFQNKQLFIKEDRLIAILMKCGLTPQLFACFCNSLKPRELKIAFNVYYLTNTREPICPVTINFWRNGTKDWNDKSTINKCTEFLQIHKATVFQRGNLMEQPKADLVEICEARRIQKRHVEIFAMIILFNDGHLKLRKFTGRKPKNALTDRQRIDNANRFFKIMKKIDLLFFTEQVCLSIYGSPDEGGIFEAGGDDLVKTSINNEFQYFSS